MNDLIIDVDRMIYPETDDPDIRFQIINGLISEVIDSTWYTECINGMFGQCILYHNENLIANIGIYGDLMVFTCHRGMFYQFNVNLNTDTSKQIEEILNYLLKYESQPAAS